MAIEPAQRPTARRRGRRALTSVSLRLLRLIVEQNSASDLLSVPVDSLPEDEQEIYRRVSAHYVEHRVMPQFSTMEEWGVTLPDAPEPLSYYQAEVQTTARMQQATDMIVALQDAITARDGDAIAAALIGRREAAFQSGVRTMSVASMVESYRASLNPTSSYNAITTTGIPVIDQEIGGFPHGDLAILSGRPGSGKTFLQFDGAMRKASRGDIVTIISKEMSEEQASHRLLAMHYDFDPRLGIQKRVSTRAYEHMSEALTEALPRYLTDNLHIVANTSVRTMADVRSVAEEYRPDTLEIDGTYFITPITKKNYQSDREKLQDIIREGKGVAADTGTAIFATWQQNRGSDVITQNGGNLYGTDAGTQDAAMIISVKRVKGHQNIRQIEVDKNRHGGGEGMIFGATYEFKPTNLGERCPLPEKGENRRERARNHIDNMIRGAAAPGSSAQADVINIPG